MKTIILISSTLILLTTSFAQPGTLDSTFSKDGKLRSSFITGQVAVRPNGKILLRGSLLDVARYKANGAIDKAFGSNGIASYDWGSWGSSSVAQPLMAVQPDGKIITAYMGENDFQNYYLFLVRFKSNGHPDSTFGINGEAMIETWNEVATGIAIDQHGKLLVSQTTGPEQWSLPRFAFVRINPNGSLEGQYSKYFGGQSVSSCIGSQSDNAVVVGGYLLNQYPIFLLTRFKSDGSFDNTFGTNGKVTRSYGPCIALTIQPDDKVITVSLKADGSGSVIERFMKDGSTDNSFGNNGKAYTNFVGTSLALQTNGKVIIAGGTSGPGGSDFILMRFNSDGSVDKTFGNKGKVITDFNGNNDVASSVAVGSDGKIVAAGPNEVARYFGDRVTALVAQAKETSNLALKESEKKSSVKMYPNPARDILHIEGLSSNASASISIIDASGKTLQKKVLQNGSYDLNINSLNPGIYFLEIVENNKLTRLKFLKE